MSFFYGTLALLYNWEGTPRSEVKSSNASKVLLNFSQKLVYPLGRKKKKFRWLKGKTLKCEFPLVLPASQKFISMKNPKHINGCRCWAFNHCKVQQQLALIYK